MNRKRVLLAFLVALLAMSLAYAFWAMPRQEKAPQRSAAPSARPAAKQGAAAKKITAAEKPSDGRLHLELLDDEVQPFPGSKRDIFRFYGRLLPAATVVATPAPPSPPPPPPPPPSPEELLRRELARYKVLGYLEKGGARSVFLASGDEVFLVRPGKSFGAQDRFIADEITATELVVSTKDRAVSVKLPLETSGAREPAVMAPVSLPRAEFETQSAPVRRLGRRAMPPAEGGEQVVEPEEAPQPEEGDTDNGAAEKALPSGEEE